MQGVHRLLFPALLFSIPILLPGESTLALRLNGHKYSLEEDYLNRAVQESYDAAIDSTDFNAIMDSLEAAYPGLNITAIIPSEDISLNYLDDTTDVAFQAIAGRWTITATGYGCNFTGYLDNIGFAFTGNLEETETGSLLVFSGDPLEPSVDVTGTGSFLCPGLAAAVETNLRNEIEGQLAAADSSLDSTGLVFPLDLADLVSSYGITDTTILAEALASFPASATVATEFDSTLGFVQLVIGLDFLTGTTSDPTAFVGIDPPAVTIPLVEPGGFSFLYHQLQGGYRWNEDWTDTVRVQTAFDKMDELLNLASYRVETHWGLTQKRAYTEPGLDPDSISAEDIDVLLADSTHWNVGNLDFVQWILGEGMAREFTPFMAVGVGHQDRTPRDENGDRIAPSSWGDTLPEGYRGVDAATYLYNLKVFAHATVRRFRDYIDVWQAENELNAAGFAAASPEWWRKGDLWMDAEFRDRVMGILVEAIRTEDPTAQITHDLHMLGFMKGLESWGDDLDIIGFNYYPNQVAALPNLGFSVGEYTWAVRRAMEGLGIGGKPVWLIETGYPGIAIEDPSDSLLLAEDMLYFSESRQNSYIQDALSSGVDNGLNRFYYFSLTAEEDSSVGGGSALATYMRFSGLIRNPSNEPKLALVPFADLYNSLLVTESTESDITAIPSRSALGQNYPNPFNPWTVIPFKLSARGDVAVRITDLLGRTIRVWNLGSLPPGRHTVKWDSRDNSGAPVSSGVFICSVEGDGLRGARKLMLLR